MVPELLHGASGSWATSTELGYPSAKTNQVFNATIPTSNGRAPNTIWSSAGSALTTRGTEMWWNDAPLAGVVSGCPQSCKVKLRAPALFSTECSSQLVPSSPMHKFNLSAVDKGIQGPPLDVDAFIITATLLLLPSGEAVDLITGYSTFDKDCKGVLNLTSCTLRSAIGEYEVEVYKENMLMDTLSSPTLVAFANNTEVEYTVTPYDGGKPSTLAGPISIVGEKYQDFVSYYSSDSGNTTGLIRIMSLGNAAEAFTRPPAQGGQCFSFSDPLDTVLESFNKIMIYAGSQQTAKSPSYLESRLDPGYPVNYTMEGMILGRHDTYHTNYWFFLGAAIVELVCIALVAPTYWGWWRIGRPVSTSFPNRDLIR